MESSLPQGTLTEGQKRKFDEDGYLVIPDFFDPSPLLIRSHELLNTFSLDGHPLTKFTTGDDNEATPGSDRTESKKHVGDEYFLSSGDKVRYFFEEDAFDAEGKLVKPKERAVNKIGHALHIHDLVFGTFTLQNPSLANLARSLGYHKDPLVLQSMIICKQPTIGGKVPVHNDSTFLYTDPPSAIGFWFALEDCTSTNGCLSFLPGSHRHPDGRIRGINKRFVRVDPEDQTKGTGFEMVGNGDEEANWVEQEARMEECRAGSLVLIHGSVLHKSEKNLSDKSRHIYTFHMIENGESNYDAKNWLQAKPFTPLFGGPRAEGLTKG